MKRIIELPGVGRYLGELSQKDEIKISADIMALAKGLKANISTKQLRGEVRELIVKRHRIVYFTVNMTLYLTGAFLKGSKKTPSRFIDQAMIIYRDILKHQKS